MFQNRGVFRVHELAVVYPIFRLPFEVMRLSERPCTVSSSTMQSRYAHLYADHYEHVYMNFITILLFTN